MLRAYIQQAMDHAHYEIIDQDESPYYGEIPELRGVIGVGRTLEECRENLEDALDEWVTLGLQLNHEIPKTNGISLEPLSSRTVMPLHSTSFSDLIGSVHSEKTSDCP